MIFRDYSVFFRGKFSFFLFTSSYFFGSELFSCCLNDTPAGSVFQFSRLHKLPLIRIGHFVEKPTKCPKPLAS